MAVVSLADKEVMPCSAFAKELRFENKANRLSGKSKGVTRRGSAPMSIRELGSLDSDLRYQTRF